MICRGRIVQARLNPEEFEKYAPMVTALHLWTWSDMIRTALKKMWHEHQVRVSDNSVIHNGHQTKTPASKSPAKKKSKPKAASRRIKTKVNH